VKNERGKNDRGKFESYSRWILRLDRPAGILLEPVGGGCTPAFAGAIGSYETHTLERK
jgi:hypothetical protein